jgi:hypothetical protein
MRRIRLHRLLAPLAGLLLAACAHYQLGQQGVPRFATLYVDPVVNHTTLPQTQAVVGTQIREAFLQDGRVALVASPAEADVILHVELKGYDREVSATRADDTGLARQFNLTLRAECSLTDRRSGRVLFEHRPVAATKGAYTDSGQLQAEYQTLPLLAEDLAALVAHTVLDVW